MTRGPRYPLEALLRLREEIRKQRELGLAEATRALEVAEGTLMEARNRHRGHLDRIGERKQRAFDEGAGAAARRVEHSLHLARLEAEAEVLLDAVRESETLRDNAAVAREAARQALAEAEAELKVVEKNREAWSEARRREALARAEAELEDLVAARRRD